MCPACHSGGRPCEGQAEVGHSPYLNRNVGNIVAGTVHEI